jgi:hypothetical protein
MAPRRRSRRNLVKRGSTYHYERIVAGRRVRRSLETSNLEEAIARRDQLERDLALSRFAPTEVPTFAAVAREAIGVMRAHRETESEAGYAATT